MRKLGKLTIASLAAFGALNALHQLLWGIGAIRNGDDYETTRAALKQYHIDTANSL